MPQLSDEEIEKLVKACGDPRNTAALNLLTYAGAYSVSGVLARIMQVSGEEREVLLKLIAGALAEHERLHNTN